MTKINPDTINPNQDALSKVSTPSKSRGKNTDASVLPLDFSRVLSAELDSTSSGLPGSAADSGGLPELEATFAPAITRVEAATPDAAGRAAAILDRLDTYAQNLADPKTSLRSAHDVLEGIDGDIQNLLTDTKEGTDTRLRGIINHLASLVAVEKIKLNRGDYI